MTAFTLGLATDEVCTWCKIYDKRLSALSKQATDGERLDEGEQRGKDELDIRKQRTLEHNSRVNNMITLHKVVRQQLEGEVE